MTGSIHTALALQRHHRDRRLALNVRVRSEAVQRTAHEVEMAPCSGGTCGDGPCRRHARAFLIATRLYRLRSRGVVSLLERRLALSVALAPEARRRGVMIRELASGGKL